MGQNLIVEDEKALTALYLYFVIFYPQLGFPSIFPRLLYNSIKRGDLGDRLTLATQVKWIIPYLRKTYPTLTFMELP